MKEKDINSAFEAWGIEDKILEARLRDHWEGAVGKDIATHTQKVEYKKGRMTVHMLTSESRYELRLKKEHILKTLHESVSQHLLKDILIK